MSILSPEEFDAIVKGVADAVMASVRQEFYLFRKRLDAVESSPGTSSSKTEQGQRLSDRLKG
jgi:hypothetical protein